MISLNDVLLAMSNIPVDDPIAEIWGRGLQGGYKIIKYTGTLPITINANGDVLLDYRIYGADGGVGVATENLIDADNPGDQRVELEPNTDYCLCKYTGAGQGGVSNCNVYDENDNRLFGAYINIWVSYSFTNPSNGAYAIISFNSATKGKLSFTKGRANNYASLYPASYIPYGYKLPMTVSDGNTEQTVPVYISDTQLAADEYVDFGEQKVYKRTENLWNPNTAEKKYISFEGRVLNSPSYALNIIPIESNATYYFYASEVYSGSQTLWQYRNNNDEIIGWDRNSRAVQRAGFTAPEGATKVIICFSNAWVDDKIRDFGFYQRSTEPPEYIPYVAPTDPPVPLPEIPTIDGTTVIDYDGDPKPSQMYVKYKGKG